MGALSAAPAWAVNPCVVASNADSGASSMRAVITGADSTPGACPTITFQSGLQTITLTSGALPAVTTDMTIDGTGSPLITTNGTGGIFSVTGGNVTFDNLTIDGDSSTPHPQTVDGGAIRVDE